MKKTIVIIFLALLICIPGTLLTSCQRETPTETTTVIPGTHSTPSSTPTHGRPALVTATITSSGTTTPSNTNRTGLQTPTHSTLTTIPVLTPTPTLDPTPTEEPEPILVNTSGCIRSDTGTYLNLTCDWKVEKIEGTNNYIFTAVVVLESYSLYCTHRDNGRLVIGDLVDTNYYSPDISIDKEAGFQTTYFTAQNCILNRDQIKSGVDLFASWSFYGTYSGEKLDVITASGHVTFCEET